MELGALAFVGIFALAGACAVWNWSRRRAISARVSAAGFEPCEQDAESLRSAWLALAHAGSDGETEIHVSSCHRRAAGFGLLHRFQVVERPREGATSDEARVGTRFDAYVLDLRDAETIARSPVTLYLLPEGNAIARRLIESTLALAAPGVKLELTPRPTTRAILAAYGAAAGKLDEHVTHGTQERIARAAAHGFLAVHLGAGKAGFAVLPGHRDVDRELAYLAEWS